MSAPKIPADKKAVFLTEVAEGSEYQAAEEYDGGDSDYEVLLAAAHELGVGEPPEELEEDEAKEILATMVRDHRSSNGGKGGGKRSFQQVNRMKTNKELAREYGVARRGTVTPGTYRVSIEELSAGPSAPIVVRPGIGIENAPTSPAHPPVPKRFNSLRATRRCL